MTAKRFIIKHYESQDWVYDNGTYIDTRMMVELLNELHEENQKLKKENVELEEFRYSIFKRIGELYEK